MGTNEPKFIRYSGADQLTRTEKTGEISSICEIQRVRINVDPANLLLLSLPHDVEVYRFCSDASEHLLMHPEKTAIS